MCSKNVICLTADTHEFLYRGSLVEKKIELAEMINTLRSELERAQKNSSGSGIVFETEKVDLELQVEVETANTAGGGVKFWVASLQGDLKQSRATSHTFKITLKPILSATKQPLEVDRDSPIPPSEN